MNPAVSDSDQNQYNIISFQVTVCLGEMKRGNCPKTRCDTLTPCSVNPSDIIQSGP